MDNIYFQSFIDIETWNAAQWRAAAFLHDPEGKLPPCLGLVFENIEAGRRIFSDWRARLGSVDSHEELRVSIIEDNSAGLESGYWVHISSNPLNSEGRAQADGAPVQIQTAVVVSRFQKMIPGPGSPHLEQFKRDVREQKGYCILPISSDLKPDFELAISKAEVHLRQASEVGIDDLDSVVFPKDHFEGSVQIH